MINYSEYNNVIIRNADLLSGFFARLDHAVQKSGAYDEVMHQLKCIGLSEELAEVANEAAGLYKKHHRARIEAEQGRPAVLQKGDTAFLIVSEAKSTPTEFPTVNIEEIATTLDAASERLLVIWRAEVTKFICDNWATLDGKPLTIEAIGENYCAYAREDPQATYLRMYIKESKLS
jgi:hypothetical protein